MGVGLGQPTKRVANCILILVCKDDKSKKLGTLFAILFEEDTCNITLTFCLCSCQSILVDYERGFLYLCHMIVWILNSPPLHQCSIVQCVGSVGQMNCFAACLLTAKTCAHFSSVIGEHLTQVSFPFAVHGAILKTECGCILPFELPHNFVPFFLMIPADEYDRKIGAGLSTQYFQGGWLEQNWVHTPITP